MAVRLQQRQSVDLIAMVAIVALVIVILAFFFSPRTNAGVSVIGLPHAEETFRQVIRLDNEHPDRLNIPTRTANPIPKVVRENGLPEGGDSQ